MAISLANREVVSNYKCDAINEAILDISEVSKEGASVRRTFMVSTKEQGIFFMVITRRPYSRQFFDFGMTDERYFDGKIIKGALELEGNRGPVLLATISGSRTLYVIDRKRREVITQAQSPSVHGVYVCMAAVNQRLIILKERECLTVYNTETNKLAKLVDLTFQAG